MLNVHLSQVSVRQNEDMRKISAWAAILVFPTIVGGIYGMNFDHMPELTGPWATPPRSRSWSPAALRSTGSSRGGRL